MAPPWNYCPTGDSRLVGLPSLPKQMPLIAGIYIVCAFESIEISKIPDGTATGDVWITRVRAAVKNLMKPTAIMDRAIEVSSPAAAAAAEAAIGDIEWSDDDGDDGPADESEPIPAEDLGELPPADRETEGDEVHNTNSKVWWHAVTMTRVSIMARARGLLNK